MSKPKVCIVAVKFPPYFSGAGLDAFKHSLELQTRNELAFILTEKFNSKTEGVFSMSSEMDSIKGKIVGLPEARIFSKKCRDKKILYYLVHQFLHRLY